MTPVHALAAALLLNPHSTTPASIDHLTRDALDAAPSLFALNLSQPSEFPTEFRDPFAQGESVFTVYGGATIDDKEGELYMARIGVGYYVWDNISANIEVVPIYADTANGEDSGGVSVDLILRWHFLRGDRWSIYIDGGAGPIVFEDDFPVGATNFSFDLQFGVGGSWRISDDVHFMGGLRWYHISNARIDGIDRNVGYDAPLVYFGVMLPF